MSNSARMLWALVLGIVAGLFFGEMVGWMSVIGQAVILLMQMTVFPYIVVSLVGGIGKLSKRDARLLFTKAGVVMVLLWLLGILVVFSMPLVFPEQESASFFSTSSITEPTPIDYYKLYIPANPFASMAEGAVPAMVLFCIAIGLALIGMSNKEQVINFTDIASHSLSRITQGLMKVLPVGIFAMSASAAGTMGGDEFTSMEVYLLAMFVLGALLAFWVLPWCVAVLTPVRYRDVIRISRTGLVTAFATGNVFIVLPVIVEECKTVLAEKNALNDEARGMIDILVPIAYSFPNIGKLTTMLFVLFAGWFADKPIDISQYFSLAFSGFLSLFGSVYVAIPFMLDLVYLPADLFQLFVISGFITGKFNSVVAVMNLFVLTLLSITLFQGLMRFGLHRWLMFGGGLAGVTLLVLSVTRFGAAYLVDKEQDTHSVIANMRVAETVPQKVSRQYPVVGETKEQPLAGIAEIKARGVLRVGYSPSNVPFSYYNNLAELVGFDVQVATMLADDLGVKLEFVPFRYSEITDGLNRGYYDIAMSGLQMTVDLMQQMNFTDPVLDLTRSLVVLDYRVKEFDSFEDIMSAGSVTVAYVEAEKLIEKVKPIFPHINFVPISQYKQFFKQKPGTYDALLISAEAGSAWTLFYPEYGVAVYNRNARYPAAYGVAWKNTDLLRYLNNWLKLKRVDGSIDKAYSYWILGKGASEKEPRWSILKNVIGWNPL